MGAPITIKKRKMTLKPTGGAESGEDSAALAEGAGVPPEPIESGNQEPAFTAPVATRKAASPSYMVYGILAIFATLCFIALLALQWTEWTYLNTQFPRPIQTGQIVSPPN